LQDRIHADVGDLKNVGRREPDMQIAQLVRGQRSELDVGHQRLTNEGAHRQLTQLGCRRTRASQRGQD
jgi:hypothetical protein